jgi:hypothetical protein
LNPFRKRREERLRRERERREARREALSARLRGETPPEVEADLKAADAGAAPAAGKPEPEARPRREERPRREPEAKDEERPKTEPERDREARRRRAEPRAPRSRERRDRERKGRRGRRRSPVSRLRRGSGGGILAARSALGRGLVSTGERAKAAQPALRRGWTRLGALLAPVAALIFRILALGERATRAFLRWLLGAARVTTRVLDRWITPERAVFGVAVAAAICLVVAQYTDYRGVQVGQPNYAGVSSIAPPPEVDVKTAGEAHSYLLVPVAGLAALAAAGALLTGRRGLGMVVALCGLIGITVSLIVDLPSGLDEGSASLRFAGAHATLEDGFYAQLAASGVLLYCGLLLALRPRAARRRARARRPKPGPRRPGARRKPRLARSGT